MKEQKKRIYFQSGKWHSLKMHVKIWPSGKLELRGLITEMDPLSLFLCLILEVTEKFGNYLIDFYSLLEIGFPPAIRSLFTAFSAFSNHQSCQRFSCTYGTWSLLEFSGISTSFSHKSYDTLSASVVKSFPKRYQNSDDQQDEQNIF